MSLFEAALLVLAGIAGGMVNAIAGGGTFLTFGALTMIGVPPIVANATSSVTQVFGYITSALGYRELVTRMWRSLVLLCLASALGAWAGAMLLISLDGRTFRSLVPWLLIAATILFALGPFLRPKAGQEDVTPARRGVGLVVQVLTSVYGGFFGAGMGVMMLATLGLTQRGDYHTINAMKNLLSVVIALVAIVIFVAGGVVAWTEALIMIPAVAIGGYLGVMAAKALPQQLVRIVVICVGLFLTVYYFNAA